MAGRAGAHEAAGRGVGALSESLEVKVGRLDERVTMLEDRFDQHCADQNRSLEKIYAKLDKFGDRPTWPVVTIISVLSSLVVGLATWVLTH